MTDEYLPAMSRDNPLPSPIATRKPTLLHALLLLALYFVLQLLTSAAVALVMGLEWFFTSGRHDRTWSQLGPVIQSYLTESDRLLLNAAVSLTLTIIICLRLLRRWWPDRWAHSAPPGFGWCAPRKTGFYFLAVVAGVVALLVGSGLTDWLSHGHAVSQDISNMLMHGSPWMRVPMIVIAITLVPLIEELLFRGVLLSALMQHVPALPAVLISATIFALVHLPGLDFEWYGLPELALLGAMAAWMRLYSGSIWTAMIVHGTSNALALIMLLGGH